MKIQEGDEFAADYQQIELLTLLQKSYRQSIRDLLEACFVYHEYQTDSKRLDNVNKPPQTAA